MTATGKVYFIGAGPGDPELITLRGQRLIAAADVIIYTDSLVDPRVLQWARPEAEVHGSASLTLEELEALMVGAARRGLRVARVHTGDPSVFGAMLEQLHALHRAGVPYEIVPGVSAVFAAAAVLGAELTVPDLCQTVILTRAAGRTPVPERERLGDLAAHHATLALFLSATLLDKVVGELREAGWPDDVPVAVVQRATWPDQKVVRGTVGTIVAQARAADIRSHAMILAGRALDPDLVPLGGYRSKLYDKDFAHRYRRAVNKGRPAR